MGLLSQFKDKATSVVAKIFANGFISDFGDLNDIIINSQSKSIFGTVTLKGEKESVTIDIRGYEVVRSENSYFIQFQSITTSREWINIVLGKYYPDLRIEIPSQFIGIIKFLL